MTTADVIATLALIVSVIGVIFNYRHTNHLFEQSNYPKIITYLEISGGNFSGITMNVVNTHPTNSVSDVHIYFKVSSRKTRLSPFPTSFTVEAMPIETIAARSKAHTLIKDSTGNATLDLNEVLVAKFPDMLVLSRDKTIQTRKIDGAPGKEVSVNDEYYKVNKARRLHIKVTTTYKPDIYKGKRKADAERYIFTPAFELSDKYRSFIHWNIDQA